MSGSRRVRALVTTTIGALTLAASAFVAAPAVSAAAPIMVTSTFCTGPGSIQEAVAAANANPGPDVIEFTPGLQVRAVGCPAGTQTSHYLAIVTDPVVFEGNGAKLVGEIGWVTSGGLLSPLDDCPRNQPSDIITAFTPGFLRVDNGADVEVRDLGLESLNSIALVRANASLVLEDVSARRILSIHDCDTPAIEVGDGSSLTLRRNNWREIVNWPGFIGPPVFVFPAIQGGSSGGAKNIDVEDSSFAFLSHGDDASGLLYWNGQAGSTVNIVSTQMNRTGGIVVSGAADSNIVNSGWSAGAIGVLAGTDRIVNDSTGTMNIVASTFMAPAVDCNTPCPSQDYDGFFRQTGAGTINLSQSAIGVNFPDSPTGLVLKADNPPGFTADEDTWIQPVTSQDATALKAITSQTNLRTDPPGLNTITLDSSFVALISPLLGTSGDPGKLIDVIDDGCGANALTNPIDLTPITTDVLGNQRCDAGNGKRNIGAVQLTLAPHLSVTGTGDRTVTLAWNRPQDPSSGAITGYAVLFRLAGSADALTRLDVAGADTLTIPVTGLTNGAEYEFEIVGVNSTGDGPPSNRVTATPSTVPGVPVLTATPGDGQVTLNWTTPDNGGSPITTYLIQYRPVGAATWQTSLTETVTGLTNGTAYEFRVAAINVNGAGGFSSVTPATPVSSVPSTTATPTTATPTTATPTTATPTSAPTFATVPPSGMLPETGSDSGSMTLVAILLMIAGAGALVASRRGASQDLGTNDRPPSG